MKKNITKLTLLMGLTLFQGVERQLMETNTHNVSSYKIVIFSDDEILQYIKQNEILNSKTLDRIHECKIERHTRIFHVFESDTHLLYNQEIIIIPNNCRHIIHLCRKHSKNVKDFILFHKQKIEEKQKLYVIQKRSLSCELIDKRKLEILYIQMFKNLIKDKSNFTLLGCEDFPLELEISIKIFLGEKNMEFEKAHEENKRLIFKKTITRLMVHLNEFYNNAVKRNPILIKNKLTLFKLLLEFYLPIMEESCSTIIQKDLINIHQDWINASKIFWKKNLAFIKKKDIEDLRLDIIINNNLPIEKHLPFEILCLISEFLRKRYIN
jgi:hypothetical protein